MRIVVDTNVLFGALHRKGGADRRLVLGCLKGVYQPVVSASLLLATVALANHDAHARFLTRRKRGSTTKAIKLLEGLGDR